VNVIGFQERRRQKRVGMPDLFQVLPSLHTYWTVLSHNPIMLSGSIQGQSNYRPHYAEGD